MNGSIIHYLWFPKFATLDIPFLVEMQTGITNSIMNAIEYKDDEWNEMDE